MSNMNPKVSEIFKAAGEAFNRLGEMTMQLHNQSETSSKWAEEDIDMLQSAITTFGQDLNKISVKIKDRTASQIRQTLTKQVFEEAGIRVQQVTVPQLHQQSSSVKLISNGQLIQQSPTSGVVVDGQVVTTTTAATGVHLIHAPPSPASSSEVMMTLNRLNAQEELDGDEDQLSADFVEEVVTG